MRSLPIGIWGIAAAGIGLHGVALRVFTGAFQVNPFTVVGAVMGVLFIVMHPWKPQREVLREMRFFILGDVVGAALTCLFAGAYHSFTKSYDGYPHLAGIMFAGSIFYCLGLTAAEKNMHAEEGNESSSA